MDLQLFRRTMQPLIILNPSTLAFLLDRRFSNLVKMIKVGITTIRARNVIIAFLSFALGAPPPPQDRYLARRPISAFSGLGRQRPGPSNLRRPRLPPRLTPFDRRFWGHASGIPSLSRPIRNSGWSCSRYRSLARFQTRRTARLDDTAHRSQGRNQGPLRY